MLSATLLDTERVWSLTNATIEPEWAIEALPHLLARRQHDPRWARSQGRVVGSEQISLFGLVLAPKRPIHYGALFPEEARQIFARDALVTGEINTRAAFLPRNLATLAKAKEEEAKQRRTGLVVDEDWQAQWYLDRLPPHVHNAQALDAWYARLSKEEKASLEWSLADLMVGDESDATRFPPYFPLGEARLAVRYRFEPGAPDDGMTVVVPLHLLNALDAARLSWLAPGFVADKATALIKSLPKALRRNFVPAPDFARAFAEAFPQPTGDAIEGELARFLHEAHGRGDSGDGVRSGVDRVAPAREPAAARCREGQGSARARRIARPRGPARAFRRPCASRVRRARRRRPRATGPRAFPRTADSPVRCPAPAACPRIRRWKIAATPSRSRCTRAARKPIAAIRRACVACCVSNSPTS